MVKNKIILMVFLFCGVVQAMEKTPFKEDMVVYMDGATFSGHLENSAHLTNSNERKIYLKQICNRSNYLMFCCGCVSATFLGTMLYVLAGAYK